MQNVKLEFSGPDSYLVIFDGKTIGKIMYNSWEKVWHNSRDLFVKEYAEKEDAVEDLIKNK